MLLLDTMLAIEYFALQIFCEKKYSLLFPFTNSSNFYNSLVFITVRYWRRSNLSSSSVLTRSDANLFSGSILIKSRLITGDILLLNLFSFLPLQTVIDFFADVTLSDIDKGDGWIDSTVCILLFPIDGFILWFGATQLKQSVPLCQIKKAIFYLWSYKAIVILMCGCFFQVCCTRKLMPHYDLFHLIDICIFFCSDERVEECGTYSFQTDFI